MPSGARAVAESVRLQTLCGSLSTPTELPDVHGNCTFLLDTVFSLFGMALLLRLWMQLTRLPTRNPVSQGVFQ